MNKIDKKITSFQTFEYFIKTKVEFKFSLSASEAPLFLDMLAIAIKEMEGNSFVKNIMYENKGVSLNIPVNSTEQKQKYIRICKEAIKDINLKFKTK